MSKFYLVFNEEQASRYRCLPDKPYPVLGGHSGGKSNFPGVSSLLIQNEMEELESVKMGDCEIWTEEKINLKKRAED